MLPFPHNLCAFCAALTDYYLRILFHNSSRADPKMIFSLHLVVSCLFRCYLDRILLNSLSVFIFGL